MNLDKYERLLRTVEEAKSKHERALGAAKQLLQQLETEYACHSLESAKNLLSQQVEQIDQLEKQLEEEMQRFTKKWKGFLDENS